MNKKTIHKILIAMLELNKPASINKIADLANVDWSTVQQYFNSLEYFDYLIQKTQNKGHKFPKYMIKTEHRTLLRYQLQIPCRKY